MLKRFEREGGAPKRVVVAAVLVEQAHGEDFEVVCEVQQELLAKERIQLLPLGGRPARAAVMRSEWA